jgi:hypothetical protein
MKSEDKDAKQNNEYRVRKWSKRRKSEESKEMK